MERPDPLRAGFASLHGFLQRLFLPADLSPDGQARRVRRLAAEKHVYKQVIYAERGAIFDANNEVLAQNVPVETVVADATPSNNSAALIPLLPARPATFRPAKLRKNCAGDRPLHRPEARSAGRRGPRSRENLRAQKLRGIYFERGTIRDLSEWLDALPRHRLRGFRTARHSGSRGVDGGISARGGRLSLYRAQRAGREIVLYRGQERAPRNGCQVHLTIDLGLQKIVENELDAAMREYTPQKATIILMRPQTGEILAMANRPNFDLNLRSEAKPEEMKNRAIIDMMEPGSTFKIVTAAAALNEQKVRPDSVIFCENGVWNVGGRPLHDHGHKGYGTLSVQDILVKSSNIGAAKLAIIARRTKVLRVHPPFRFWRSHRHRIARRDSRDDSCRRESWSKISITRIPMGHEVGVTPLQMIVGDGDDRQWRQVDHAPHRQVSHRRGGQDTRRPYSPVVMRQVISPETAAQIGIALRGVVSDRGTAAAAAVPGFTMSRQNRHRAKSCSEAAATNTDKYVVSFQRLICPPKIRVSSALSCSTMRIPRTRNLNYGGTRRRTHFFPRRGKGGALSRS